MNNNAHIENVFNSMINDVSYIKLSSYIVNNKNSYFDK